MIAPLTGTLEVEASLWRIYSNVFSTPLTVGHCASWFPGLLPTQKNKEEFHIHLLGADEPEVKAVQEGIILVISQVVMYLYYLSLVTQCLVCLAHLCYCLLP